MNKTIYPFVYNGETINIICTKKKVKRWTIRIGDYNRTNHTFDCLMTIPFSLSMDDAIKAFRDHYEWYSKLTSEMKKNILSDNYTYLLGSVVTKLEFKEGLEETLSLIISRFDYYKELFRLNNVKLKLRNMKSRWGVFNRVKCQITLSTRLVHLPVNLIDYVIIHEFCHYYHFDHSKEFYNLVSLYYPDYKQARIELKKYTSF